MRPRWREKAGPGDAALLLLGKRLDQLPDKKTCMADGGRHVGPVVGEYAGQLPVQDEPWIESGGPLAGLDGVVQQFGAVARF